MNMLKKSLAMFLALCMLFSAAPMTVFAEEIDSTNPIVTEATEETTAPAETVPETTVAPETVPETTVAPETVPQETVPQETVPQETVPQETVPQETVPQETVPQETVPQETVPQQMISQDLLPQVTVPQMNDPLASADPNALVTTDVDADIAPIAITMGTKPANGTTEGEPFPKGTGGSNSFRIPALVTLKNGNLLAAADARWNTTYDGGGLDTIVSISTDGGKNWSYQFANYLGDNGNEYNGTGSTAFIDPALAVTGNTVYMLVDIYPYGIALNGEKNTAPVTRTGFNSKGKLLLSGNNHSSYDYYLDGNTIYGSDGNAVSGYTVDEYFNITSDDGAVKSNLFFSDSPFKVVRTGFLYLTKSTDGGETWSAPELLNLKTSSEQVCLVGPGRGLVTSDGKVIFPVYSYNGSDSSQQMGFISYNGKSWSRSDNFTGAAWSSESAVVELTGGTLRFFYRNGTANLCYVDYKDGWGTPVVMDGSNGTECIDTNSNCQLSAITYSKTVDGKKLILVSCPTGPNEAGSSSSQGGSYSSGGQRLNGKIFAFTVEADGSLKKAGAIRVTSNNAQFMYSCLTELDDGTVGILYEDHQSAWGNGYYTMSYVEYDLAASMGLSFDGATTEPSEPDTDTDITVADEGITVESVTAVTKIAGLTNFVAYDVTLTKDGANYKKAATITIPLNGKFGTDVTLWGFVLETDGTVKYVKDAVRDYEKDTLTFLAPHFSTVGGAPAKAADSGDGTLSDTVDSSGGSATTYVLDKDGLDVNAQYLIVYDDNALTNTKGSLAVTVTGDNATPSGDASAALWTYTSWTSGMSTRYGLMSGSDYLYPSRTNSGGMWNPSYSYSLNINGTQTRLRITNNNDGTYSIADNSYNAYVAYTSDGWDAQKDAQNLSFYKYTPGTQTYTVNAALQASRIEKYTVEKDGYTDDSWNAYQAALTAAQNKLASVEATNYASETAANTALNELIQQVEALETAKNNLKKAVTVTVNYVCDGKTVASGKFNVAEDEVSITLPNTVTDGTNTYRVNNTTLTLKDGVNATYSVPVTLVEGTPITIKENETRELEVSLSAGQYVEWSTADSNYVNVAGKYDAANKKYTNAAVIVGQNVTTSPVLVTGTVYNAKGTVAGVQKWLVTVTEGDADTNTTSRKIVVDVVTIEHCTVYYSINAGELIKINGTGVLIDETTTGHFNMMFFAKPDEGYALTYMFVSGSGNQYYTLSDGNPDGTGSGAWPLDSDVQTTIPGSKDHADWVKDHGFRWALLEGNYGIDQMKAMFTQAIALGCDGATNFTKNGTESFSTQVSFVAQKLPEMEKKIVSVTKDGSNTATPYTDGIAISLGDTINYEIYVYSPETTAAYGHMTYTDLVVVDELTNETWATNPGATIPSHGVTQTTIADKVETVKFFTYVDPSGKEVTYNGTTAKFTYETSITLTAANYLSVVKNGKITNTADMTYKYKSQYSSGSSEVVSNAVAEVHVDTPVYVIDFGLPVQIDMSSHLASTDKITGATAKYGRVDVIEGTQTIKYTPTSILQGEEFITLKFQSANNTAISDFGISIYPATTVYYEEGFLFTDASKIVGTWKYLVDNELPENQVSNKGRGPQAAVVLGHAGTNNFGYDDHYAGTTTDPMMGSDGTWAMSDAVDDTTSFTFTGTGFQLYANSDTGSGIVSVYSRGGIQKIYTIDTGLKVPTVDQNGSGISPNSLAQDVTDTKTYYSLPVVSETNLPYGTYIVTIRHTKDSKPIYLDGVRIFNTLESSTVFTSDLEDKPVFHELRDHVLKAIGVENLNDSDYIDGGNDSAPNDNRDGQVDKVNQMAGQVYNALAAADGTVKDLAVVLNQDGTDLTTEQVQNLLDDGPKNELYLYPGQTLVFSVTTDRVMQLGLKSPIGNAKFTIKVSTNGSTDKVLDLNSLSTSVDMFYKIADKSTTGKNKYTVTITVTKDTPSVLSVTTLKICDDPSFSFNSLTQEDIENALLSIYGLDKVENPFEDVIEEDFFYNAVLWAHENGITNGMDDTHFIPTGMCNRAQIVTFLWRAMGKPAPTTTVNPFVDVTESDFFYDAVLWAHENGITNGVDATHFNPTGECNRAQAVTFLWRAVGEPESTADVDFTDVQPGQFYSAAVAWAFEKGITNGMGDGTFGVLESCNRAQVVTFLYRALAPR